MMEVARNLTMTNIKTGKAINLDGEISLEFSTDQFSESAKLILTESKGTSITMDEVIVEEIPKLKPCREGDTLLASDPFKPFRTDCTHCKYYWEQGVGFIEGGYCSEHNNKGCGWGFTCNDWEEKQ